MPAAARRYGDAAGILLDSYSPKVAGGSGETFDWSRVPRDLGRPLILAGGLTPDNVARAIAVVRPYAVDVSSGVERAKGVKDRARIEAFVRAVAAA
jgi:phosphoribosylanthranilate isomerase